MERRVSKVSGTTTFLLAIFFAVAFPANSQQPAVHQRPHKQPPAMMSINESSALWERYLAAGEAAHRKNDDKTAKRYWLGALTELEKGKKGNTGHWGRLQHRLIDLYPRDYEKLGLDQKALQAMQEEQVALYARIERMNKYLGTTGLSVELAQSAYNRAADQLAATKKRASANQPTHAN